MMQAFRDVLTENIQHLGTIEWDKAERPKETEADALGHPYSYTSDYLLYKRCPRQYMLFRHYGFVPARSTVMFFDAGPSNDRRLAQLSFGRESGRIGFIWIRLKQK
jgi:hypothetical protein